MLSNKINRINEDIQRVLSAHLANIKDPRVRQGMISVTAVDASGDLRHAKVYLSAFGIGSEKELMKGLKSASGYLRSELARSLKLRNTPELSFQLDKSIEHGARINKLLGNIGTGGDGDDNNDP